MADFTSAQDEILSSNPTRYCGERQRGDVPNEGHSHSDLKTSGEVSLQQEEDLENVEVPKDDLEKNAKVDGLSIEPTVTQSSQVPASKARRIALVVTLTGAALLNTLSVQAAVIVLPTIGRDLSIPAARQQWIVSAYSLAFGCFLLPWGRLADVYGKRLIFIFGSAWVCIVTLVCPFVPSEIGFDVMRGLQGLGAAANVPTAIGILGVTFPPGKEKAYAFSFYSSGAPMGSALGNILAGLVGQYASWKWIFWILAIIAAIVTVAAHFVIPLPVVDSSPIKLKNEIDWAGGTLITIALFALLFALTEGNVVGWGTPYIGAVIGISVVLLAAFVCWQIYLEKKSRRKPLMKMSIFKNSRVCAAMITMALFFSAFNNLLIFATYFYQDYHGLNPVDTMLRFIPTGVAGICTIMVTAQLLARVKVNYIVMFGTLCSAVSSLLFAIPISPNTTYWAYGFPAMCICVMGADTLFPSLVLFNAHSLPKEDQSLGGALINAVGQIGRAIGLAIATAIQVSVQESRAGSDAAAVTGDGDKGSAAFLVGLRAANWFDVGLGVVAFVVVSIAFRGAPVLGASK